MLATSVLINTVIVMATMTADSVSAMVYQLSHFINNVSIAGAEIKILYTYYFTKKIYTI